MHLHGSGTQVEIIGPCIESLRALKKQCVFVVLCTLLDLVPKRSTRRRWLSAVRPRDSGLGRSAPCFASSSPCVNRVLAGIRFKCREKSGKLGLLSINSLRPNFGWIKNFWCWKPFHTYFGFWWSQEIEEDYLLRNAP